MSTTKVINYDTGDQNEIAHNSEEILIDINGATFKSLPLQVGELMVATSILSKDADRSAGSLIGTALNGATRSAPAPGNINYYNVEGSINGRSWQFDGAGVNFVNEGTIRFKIKTAYSGNPVSNRIIFVIKGDAGKNDIIFFHKVDGTIEARFNNNAGVIGSVVGFGGAVWNTNKNIENEFELNIDTKILGGVNLFIDGIAHGVSGNAFFPRTDVDFLYLGSDTGPSDCIIRDFECLLGVQHLADFSGEIPRSIALYPQFSKIVPSEFSVSEGFENVAHDLIANGDSKVDYVMLIEFQEYYDDGNNLLASDGTPAQSNTIAEWIDQDVIDRVDAFISTGARLTMVPIPNSGISRQGQLLLKSTTVTYDFFAIASACIESTLYGFVKDNCKNIVSGTVRVWLKKPIRTQGTVNGFDETVDIRINGFFEIPLVIPNLPTVENRPNDLYFMEANWIDDEGLSWNLKKHKILIGENATTLYEDAIIIK